MKKTMNVQREALLRQAMSAFKAGQFFHAKSMCMRLLARNKNDVGAMEVLAKVLYEAGEFKAGIEYQKRCVAALPKSVHLLMILGGMLRAEGQHAEAVKYLLKAQRLEPQNRMVLAFLADAYERNGEPDAVRQLVEPLLADNDNPLLVKPLAMVELSEGNPKRAVDLLEPFTRGENVPAVIWFAVGKAYEKIGDADRAFHAYSEAKKESKPPFSIQAHTEYIDSLIKAFSQQNLARLPRANHGSELPILVTGRPRSGTTLVGRIIAAHPDVADAGENSVLGILVRDFPVEIGSSLTFPEAIRELDQNDVNQLGRKYLNHISGYGRHAKRIADKSMANYFNLGLVELILPKARVIHTRRNPVDTCLACFSENLGRAFPFSYDLRDLGLSHLQYERLMRHWHEALELQILDVDYEELVQNQEGVSRRIIEFCGLPWSEECLRFHEKVSTTKDTGIRPTLSYDQVRKPIYKTSVGRAAKFQKHLGPLYEALQIQP